MQGSESAYLAVGHYLSSISSEGLQLRSGSSAILGSLNNSVRDLVSVLLEEIIPHKAFCAGPNKHG